MLLGKRGVWQWYFLDRDPWGEAQFPGDKVLTVFSTRSLHLLVPRWREAKQVDWLGPAGAMKAEGLRRAHLQRLYVRDHSFQSSATS